MQLPIRNVLQSIRDVNNLVMYTVHDSFLAPLKF